MAEQLEQIYRIIEEKTGFKGRMRLVVKTGVPKSLAISMHDDPAVMEKFKIAANDILGRDINEFLNVRQTWPL
ncbi:MAG: hypothetical protein MUP71_10165 [Candidatus Aminicenantes bacterium]|nr:hypothetical protein [Candidatus Aminicenantes bacterium]